MGEGARLGRCRGGEADDHRGDRAGEESMIPKSGHRFSGRGSCSINSAYSFAFASLGSGSGISPRGRKNSTSSSPRPTRNSRSAASCSALSHGMTPRGSASIEEEHHDERAEHGAPVVADAAGGEREEDVDGEQRHVDFRHDVARIVAHRARPARPASAPPIANAFTLNVEHVLAGEGRDLRVLADRAQHAAERRGAHALQNEQHDGEDDEAEHQVERG